MGKTVPVEEGRVNVNGVELYYKIMGLHGGPGFDHNYMLPLSQLADDYRVIFYDQRATGDSTGVADANSITVDNFVEDLEGLRKELNLGKMHVIGHSWGGGLAIYYGIKYPANLRSLILLAAGGGGRKYFEEYFENVGKRMRPEDAAAMREIEQSDAFKNWEVEAFERYYRIAMKPFFCAPSLAGQMDFCIGRNTVKNQRKTAELLMKDIGDFDIHGKLAVIDCPTLLICGDSDPGPCWGPYKIHKHIPQSKIVFLKNTGHMPFVESAKETFSLIRSFLRDDKTVASRIPPEIEERLKSVSF
ncbi:MAG: alpha/beta fold hydrolase [Planctomycetota bacterium]|jgi:proline iminopeptidase